MTDDGQTNAYFKYFRSTPDNPECTHFFSHRRIAVSRQFQTSLQMDPAGRTHVTIVPGFVKKSRTGRAHLIHRTIYFVMIFSTAMMGHLEYTLFHVEEVEEAALVSFESPALPASRLYPLLLKNRTVLIYDSIWIPQSSQVALLGVRKNMFQMSENFKKGQSVPTNATFSWEHLSSPLNLLPDLSWDNIPIEKCADIASKARDPNCDNKIFTVVCDLPSNSSNQALDKKFHVLNFKENEIGRFNAMSNTFNSASNDHFFRRQDTKTDAGHLSQNIRLSIAIKSIKGYHPLIPDMIQYYQKQGVQHVYIGLVNPSREIIDLFMKSLSPRFKHFFSLGWFESNDMIFNDTHTHRQQIFLKLMFINSVLFNTKAFGDDLLMVVDVDEIPVSMTPTKTTFVDEFAAATDFNSCFMVLHPYNIWRREVKKSWKIGDMFPLRCAMPHMGFYHPKSAAVVKNSNFLGIHQHGGCINGARRKDVDPKILAFHHYTSFWGKVRHPCRNNKTHEVASEIAIFQAQGLHP